MNRDLPFILQQDRKTLDNLSSTSSSKPKSKVEQNRGPFEWWYRFTSPPVPPKTASFAQREIVRRARLASLVIFFIIIFGGIGTPGIIASHNPYTPYSHAVSMLTNLIALYLNRRGKVNLSGSLVVFSMTLSLTVATLASSTVGINNLLVFELLTLPELLAVALLPPWSVAILVVYNCLLVWFDLNYFPHSKELQHIMETTRFFFTLAPMVLYAMVAVVTYLFASNTLAAIRRADQAEELAALEQRERERQEQEIEQKHQIDLGIQQILQTHVQVANGNFSARAPLTKENVLWRIAYSLNNLLARLQSYGHIEKDLQRAQFQSREIIDAMRLAKQKRAALHVERRGTFLDPIVLEINNHTLTYTPEHRQQASPRLVPYEEAPRTPSGFTRTLDNPTQTHSKEAPHV